MLYKFEIENGKQYRELMKMCHMNIDVFTSHLKEASGLAIIHGSNYISNVISENITYDIEYNMSSDDNMGEWFDRYPDDDGRISENLSFEEVVNELYRNDKVPAWIDISIIASNKGNTRLNLVCSGRYTNRLDDLYYVKQRTSPFGIKSPRLLPWIQENEKYHLFYKRNSVERTLDKLRWKVNVTYKKLNK